MLVNTYFKIFQVSVGLSMNYSNFATRNKVEFISFITFL